MEKKKTIKSILFIFSMALAFIIAPVIDSHAVETETDTETDTVTHPLGGEIYHWEYDVQTKNKSGLRVDMVMKPNYIMSGYIYVNYKDIVNGNEYDYDVVATAVFDTKLKRVVHYSVGHDAAFGFKRSDSNPFDWEPFVSTNDSIPQSIRVNKGGYSVLPNYPIFNTKKEMENYLETGDASGAVNKNEDTLLMRDLKVTENKTLLDVLKSSTITWTPSTYPDYPSEDLKVEIKINGQVINKNSSVIKELNDEMIFPEIEKDDTGSYEIDMADLRTALISKHSLNGAIIGGIKIKDYSCRYVYKDAIYGAWRTIGFYDPELEHSTPDKDLGIVKNFKVTFDKKPGSKMGTSTWLPSPNATDNTRLQINFLARTINKSSGQIINYTKAYDWIGYPDDVKDSAGSYIFDYNKVTYDWLESIGVSSLLPVSPQIGTFIYRYIRLNDDNTYSHGEWSRINTIHGVTIDGKFVETPLTDGIFGDGTVVTERVEGVTVNKDEDGNITIDDNGGDKTATDNDGNSVVNNTDLINAGNVTNIFEWFVKQFNTLSSSVKTIPTMIASVVSWLPSPIIIFIGIGVVISILLRILGR